MFGIDSVVFFNNTKDVIGETVVFYVTLRFKQNLIFLTIK